MGLVEDIIENKLGPGKKWEDLNPLERQSVNEILDKYTKAKELTVNDIRAYVHNNIIAVEQELVETDEFEYFFFGLLKRVSRKQILLKARLKSYLLTEKLLISADQAKEQLKSFVTK